MRLMNMSPFNFLIVAGVLVLGLFSIANSARSMDGELPFGSPELSSHGEVRELLKELEEVLQNLPRKRLHLLTSILADLVKFVSSKNSGYSENLDNLLVKRKYTFLRG
ncbi:hypothetical protein SprV_0200796200 [Sparganum proliferum]